jgi:hypothetical protein
MELAEMEITPTQIRAGAPANSPLARVLAHTFSRTFTRTSATAARLKVFWRSVFWISAIWTSLVGRAGRKRKTLSVCETAALGDRRFVSVIQFERQRFLIGSSPSSITLLSKLPDESSSGEVTGKASGGKN